MELDSEDKILRSKQLTNNSRQASKKVKTSANWPDEGNVFPAQCRPEEVKFPIQEAEGQGKSGQGLILRHNHTDPGYIDPYRRQDSWE